METAIVIGCGISGLTCAVKLAEKGVRVTLVSPYPSERAQSVMAAGGINAVLPTHEEGDSVAAHIEDTLKGGSYLAGEQAVSRLCTSAADVIAFLESIGTVFTEDGSGRPARRAFGGQSFKRTCFSGSSTGKQIISALVMEARRYEARGRIKRRLWSRFHSALIKDGICHGVIVYDEKAGRLQAEYADAVVIAAGGQNALFGKTTGSTQCDGYVAGKLFLQGVQLKNLEFIQYHPTTLLTPQKRMLISEAARGEGGRLFCLREGKRVYFLEDAYGPRGNLMTRDVISREIARAGGEVFLDVSFLGEDLIDRKIPEVRELCLKYAGLDIAQEPIPVAPSVHFFMGGLAVHMNHETNIRNLFAVGECASMYHGANRLGGNSLLAALHSAMVAADEISQRSPIGQHPYFTAEVERQTALLAAQLDSKSRFPAQYIRDLLADTMNCDLGIVRDESSLAHGIDDVDYYLSLADKINFDSSVSPYEIYSLEAVLSLARAVLVCARERRESRGAHYRADYPDTQESLGFATIISYDEGRYQVSLDKEHAYER